MPKSAVAKSPFSRPTSRLHCCSSTGKQTFAVHASGPKSPMWARIIFNVMFLVFSVVQGNQLIELFGFSVVALLYWLRKIKWRRRRGGGSYNYLTTFEQFCVCFRSCPECWLNRQRALDWHIGEARTAEQRNSFPRVASRCVISEPGLPDDTGTRAGIAEDRSSRGRAVELWRRRGSCQR